MTHQVYKAWQGDRLNRQLDLARLYAKNGLIVSALYSSVALGDRVT
jgi:hypothetical protein